ncbi:MAG: hypothetical protein ACREAB_12870 [Blastocatellia bacterium]
MKRFSIFAVCLFAVLLSTSVLGQSPQSPQSSQDPQGPRGARQRGGRHGGKNIKQMDTDNDGAISRDEWKGAPKAFDRIDRNNDGSLSIEEVAPAGRNQGKGRIKQMDANNDGKISRDEWRGRDKAFGRLDANNDGVITREEIEARRQKSPNPPGI